METLENVGRYETVRLLGRGGMGEVYLARDPLIDRLVAIKLLADGFDAAARARFTREARAAGRLQHENIATIFDVGEHHGRPFIAMEYVRGETLATLIRQEPPLATAEMLRLVEDACVGLAFAHNAGIVHLDVKPENLMRCPDGRLKVLDFGIARVVEGDETSTLNVIGTLRYMSPEQLTGGPIDRRSDVFGVGCVLYEVIARQPAFGRTVTDIMSRVTGAGVVPLGELVPGVHPELVRIAGRAMAPDKTFRYDNLETMRHELATVRREIEAGGEQPTATSPVARSERPRAWPLAWVMSAALIAAFATGIWLLPGQSPPPSTRPSPVDAPVSIPKPPASNPIPRAEPNTPTASETDTRPSRAAPLPPRTQSAPAPAREPVPPPTPMRSADASNEPQRGLERSEPPPATQMPPLPSPPVAEVAPTPPVSAPRQEAPNPEDAVRAVLRAYEAAHDQRDVAALRAIFPTLPAAQAQAMARIFAGAIKYNVELTVLDLRVTGSTASAACDVTHEFVPKVGNASKNTVQTTFQLHQVGGAWLIERIEGATKR
jgi:eukaryotic-like serine/threonine-protein kinase